MDYSGDIFSYRNYFEEYSHIKSHLIVGEETENTVFVSIIIPTFKRPLLLNDAINSAINQIDFDDFEIVIVDNDPEQSFKTETQLLIENYKHPKIRYYKHDLNIGMFANWNRGIELAKGEWVTLLHDDDAIFSYYLREMSRILAENPRIEGLKGKQYYWKDDQKKSIFEVEREVSFKKGNYRRVKKIDNYFVNSIGPTGLFYKKKNIINLGGFSPDYYPSSDYLFGTKYLFYFNTYITFDYLGVYRWAENESLKYCTIAAMIAQDYVFRNQYRKLLRLNGAIWDRLNTYLTQSAIRNNLLAHNQELEPDFKRILEQKVKNLLCVKFLYRLYRVNLTIRDKTFFLRLSKKIMKNNP